MSSRAPPAITIVDCSSLIVFTCVLNQSTRHWLLSNALNSTITMSSKATDEMHLTPSFESFMDDDTTLYLELATRTFNIKS